ncbi:MAG: galactose-1-phosphate uridylyltransferase [Candidatus Margulisbacteria bacterium]|nr:galactose-1-phosphate uridylyltransferase [Candidatus Margulisiibacteriota bacterium]
MSELRYNVLFKEWVIIATERAKRPEDFKTPVPSSSKDTSDKCPFCPGHEGKTPPESFAFREPGTAPNTAGWRVRVIPNQFPALTLQGSEERKTDGEFYISMDGFGKHDVIIESPDHLAALWTMGQDQVEAVFLAYRESYQAMAADPRFEAIILFKNYGPNAGTSLMHPHSQIVALPIIPMVLRQKILVAHEYFEEHGHCLYCNLIKKEAALKERIIFENENYFAFTPYASHSPFEIFILPKEHSSDFGKISEQNCRELARVMQTVLKKLKVSLNGPDYNFNLFSAPTHSAESNYYHWHFKITPQVTKSAGFEMGSGIFINTVIPEEAARYLREAAV